MPNETEKTTPTPAPAPATRSNPAVNLARVLEDERDAVKQLCDNRQALSDLSATVLDGRIPDRLGIAFSGGGIRSACVNLGIIQALAKAKLLKQVHYMC